MDKIKKSQGTAVKAAKICRTLSIIWVVCAGVGAILSVVMGEFIAQYYSDPSNVAAASASLDADMGIFSFLPFDSMKEAGNYGLFFAVQLLCAAVSGCVYVYLFSILTKVMESIRDTGKAFDEADASKIKNSFIIITVLLFLFSGLFEAVIAGVLLCGLYNMTLAAKNA